MKLVPATAGAALALLMASTSTFAATTYLTCEFTDPSGKPQVFNFALDQEAGTFGVYVPASGSERMERGTFADNKASLNEGAIAWEIDLASGTIIRDRRMLGEKDQGSCSAISAERSGFEQ